LNETAVVPRQPQEATQPPKREWLQPSSDDVNLVFVHGHTLRGDHVA
jgi:hypothetical protein